MNVSDFLDAERFKPFVWGETDCGTTADRWFMIERGFSAFERHGRRVTNEAVGRAWIDEPGGLVRAARHVFTSAGVSLLRGKPCAGDVGLIAVDSRVCVAIFDGVTWHSRDCDGLIVTDDSHRFIAWEVATCRKHLVR